MNSDSDLLQRYVEAHDEPAFTELVLRHLGLVYSVALRRVGGDAQLAEDVAQKVFSDLACKAPALLARPTLSGWLYTSAHLASAAVVRAERRRKVRESEAHIMQATLSSESDADWTRLRPVIDDVIVGLKEEDREAIALRFFEKRSFAEVGAALRTTEEAARKRVDRALEKLRAMLGQRGITSTAAALGVTLTAIGSTSAPAGLGSKVAGQAFASASVPAGGSLAGAVWSAAWPAAAVLVLGGILIGSQHRANDRLRAELAQFASDNRAIAATQTKNQRLVRSIAQAEEQRRAAAAVSSPQSTTSSTPVAARPISATINVTASGTLAFNKDFVSLRELISRLQTLQATTSPEARLQIRAMDASFDPPPGAIDWVIEEARKVGIKYVTVESNTAPDPKVGSWWF